MGAIEVIKGDITKMDVDAIVNAANTTLMGGGGVDGAIHRAAGPELLEECRQLEGCESGHAKITAGYDLPARYVIHTVGPVWNNGMQNEEALLASCYRNSLRLAASRQLRTIAFPSISTGVYRFPFQRASAIAIKTINEFLSQDSTIEKIFLVCFSDEDFKAMNALLNKAM